MIYETAEDLKKMRDLKKNQLSEEPLVLKTDPTIVQGQDTINLTPKEINNPVNAEISNQGYIKRFIPYYIYKPPFGFPRRDIDLINCRRLAKTPFVFSVIKTLLDEITAAKWDIIPNEGYKDEDVKQETKKIKEFFYNPNGNNQSFRSILRGVCRDLLELDAGVIEKVYNRKGEISQLFTVDGSTILLNPDEHGYIGNRADYVPIQDFRTLQSQEAIAHYYTNYLKEQASYFQYNWTGGVWPVPFGKKELIYIMANDNTDSIYGTSPIQVLYNILLILLYGSKVNLDMYANNNIPTGMLVMLDANKDQIDAMRTHLTTRTQQQDMYGNQIKQYFQVPISPKEVQYVDFKFNAKDMQMLEQQKWYQQLVWSVFGVTPEEMSTTDASNRSTANEQSRIFKRKALAPIFKLIEYHLNTQLVWELDPTKKVQFKFDDYDIESEYRKSELNEKLLNTTWTLNEIRQKDNMEPLEGEEYDKPKGTAPSSSFGNDMFSNMDKNNNEANKEDMQNEERSPEKEGKLFQKPDDMKILKHKYIRREGQPGNYTYYYKDEKGKEYSSKDDTSNKPNKEQESNEDTSDYDTFAEDIKLPKDKKEFQNTEQAKKLGTILYKINKLAKGNSYGTKDELYHIKERILELYGHNTNEIHKIVHPQHIGLISYSELYQLGDDTFHTNPLNKEDFIETKTVAKKKELNLVNPELKEKTIEYIQKRFNTDEDIANYNIYFDEDYIILNIRGNYKGKRKITNIEDPQIKENLLSIKNYQQKSQEIEKDIRDKYNDLLDNAKQVKPPKESNKEPITTKDLDLLLAIGKKYQFYINDYSNNRALESINKLKQLIKEGTILKCENEEITKKSLDEDVPVKTELEKKLMNNYKELEQKIIELVG